MRHLPLIALLVLTASTAACNDNGAIVVRELSFEGVTAIDEAQLRGVLATRQSSRLPWGRKQYFDRARFETDLKRIEIYYEDRGYPEARVTSFDVQLGDAQTEARLKIVVNEGEPVRVTAVELENFTGALPPNRLDDLRTRMPLDVGEPRDRQEVLASQELAVNELRERGYPWARVATDEVPGRDQHTAVVRFVAEPGPLARFGPVEISGNLSVSDGVIRRQLTFRPGDLYRRSAVQESQRRLYALELFQFVNIETLDAELQPPEVRSRVTVAEGDNQRVTFGVGYGTEEKGRVDGEYHHLNFLGGARSAGLQARWSSLDRGVRADFNQPYFFHPRLAFGAEGQQWYTFTPAYRSVVTGGSGTIIHRPNPRTSVSLSLTNEHNSSAIETDILGDTDAYFQLRNDLIALGLDPTSGRQEGTLNAIGAELQRSTAGNLLDATRGYQIALHAEAAGRFLPGSYNYTALSADGRHYLPLGDGAVLATRLQVGSIEVAGGDPTNVPFSKKYFLGGASTMRGWGRYEVSPLSGSGLPLGGNSLVAFSGELRLRLKGSLGGVLFLDAGNVWADRLTAVDLGDLRYAVGPGLRYQTPVGPVRLDVGYQLTPIEGLLVNGEPEKRRWRIHFSIGQAF